MQRPPQAVPSPNYHIEPHWCLGVYVIDRPAGSSTFNSPLDFVQSPTQCASIWQGYLESNQEQWNQNLLCYHYTIPQQFGAVDGDRTRRDLIDSQVSPPGELYGIFGGPAEDRTPTKGLQSPCATIITTSPINHIETHSSNSLGGYSRSYRFSNRRPIRQECASI